MEFWVDEKFVRCLFIGWCASVYRPREAAVVAFVFVKVIAKVQRWIAFFRLKGKFLIKAFHRRDTSEFLK
jgi:hypothetical protein